MEPPMAIGETRPPPGDSLNHPVASKSGTRRMHERQVRTPLPHIPRRGNTVHAADFTESAVPEASAYRNMTGAIGLLLSLRVPVSCRTGASLADRLAHCNAPARFAASVIVPKGLPGCPRPGAGSLPVGTGRMFREFVNGARFRTGKIPQGGHHRHFAIDFKSTQIPVPTAREHNNL